MTICIYKDIIEPLLRKNKLYFYIFLTILLHSCKSNYKEENSTKKILPKKPTLEVNQKINDTIFFKDKENDILEVVSKDKAGFFRVVVDTTSQGYKFIDFSTYQYSSGVYEPKRAGYILNLHELSPEKALANGKWLVFGNDSDLNNPKYHSIGYYKNGVKDSIWYTSYEDGWNKHVYYKNGEPIDYVGEAKFYGYGDSLIAEGLKFIKNGFPIGKWKYYYVNDEIIEHEYLHLRDSILVKYTSYNKKTNSIIDKGTFIATKYVDEFQYREVEE